MNHEQKLLTLSDLTIMLNLQREEIIRRVAGFIVTMFGLQVVLLVVLYLTWGRP